MSAVPTTLPSVAVQRSLRHTLTIYAKETKYDGAGQVIEQIDGNHHKTEYRRNELEQVKEVVDAALFLADATFTSGEVLHVDGGAHAGKW